MRIDYLNIKQGNESTTSYIIPGKSGDLLVDTGTSGSMKKLEEWLEGYNVKYIFLTHGHLDHVWNVAEIKKKYGAEVIMHEKDRHLPQDFSTQKLYPISRKQNFRTWYTNTLGKLIVPQKFEAEYPVGDGDTDLLEKLGFNAKIVMLPGHTRGSMGIMHRYVLYCGDAFTMMYGKPEAVYFGSDVEKLFESMKKIYDLRPEYLATGHGLPIEFEKAKEEFKKYV